MAKICRCGVEINPRRVRLGLYSCRNCGEKDAKAEALSKGGRVVQAFNKGGFVYSSEASIRQSLLDAGRKSTSEVSTEVNSNLAYILPREKAPKRGKDQIIGIYWKDGQAYAWRMGVSPQSVGATRWVKTK